MSIRLTQLSTKFQHKTKMNQGRISANYARALWEWAYEKGLAPQVYNQSAELIEFINQNPDFTQLLNSQSVSISKKQSICEKVVSKIAPDLTGIISLHIKNGRESNLGLTLRQYQKIYREKTGISKVVVESVALLSSKLVNDLKRSLHDKFKKSIEIEQIVNPDLIGGFTLTIDDNYLDKSVRGELEIFRKKLVDII